MLSVSRFIQLLENNRGGLNPAERQQALANLDRLTRHQAFYGLEAISLEQIGFAPTNRLYTYSIKGRDRQFFRERIVPINQLCYAQHDVAVAGLVAYINGENIATGKAEERWGELPDVVLSDGNMHIMSGHTRLSVQALAGRQQVAVNLICYDSRTKRYTSPRVPN